MFSRPLSSAYRTLSSARTSPPWSACARGSLDVAAARTFLTDRVADYKRPRRVVVCAGPLPRTTMGKLDKRALREMLEADDAP